jgi:hypothetical protein
MLRVCKLPYHKCFHKKMNFIQMLCNSPFSNISRHVNPNFLICCDNPGIVKTFHTYHDRMGLKTDLVDLVHKKHVLPSFTVGTARHGYFISPTSPWTCRQDVYTCLSNEKRTQKSVICCISRAETSFINLIVKIFQITRVVTCGNDAVFGTFQIRPGVDLVNLPSFNDVSYGRYEHPLPTDRSNPPLRISRTLILRQPTPKSCLPYGRSSLLSGLVWGWYNRANLKPGTYGLFIVNPLSVQSVCQPIVAVVRFSDDTSSVSLLSGEYISLQTYGLIKY